MVTKAKQDKAQGPKKKSAKKGKQEKGKAGRPTKLTPDVIEKFTEAVAIGSAYTLASAHAGISYDTSTYWLREGRRELARIEAGERPDPKMAPYLRFLREVRVAEAEAGIKYQMTLDRAAASDPQWAWKMARVRFPMDYNEMNTVEEVEIPEDMDLEYYDRIIAGESPILVVRDWKIKQQGVLENAGKAKE